MPRRPLILFSLAAVLLAFVTYQKLLSPPRAQAQIQIKRLVFSPTRFEPQPVLDPQPAIIQPKYVSAEEGKAELRPNELVLGVVIDGRARAYPMNMLTGPRREIFNDRLGEQDIAATW